MKYLLILHEKATPVSVFGVLLIFAGFMISQKKKSGGCAAKRCHVSEKA